MGNTQDIALVLLDSGPIWFFEIPGGPPPPGGPAPGGGPPPGGRPPGLPCLVIDPIPNSRMIGFFQSFLTGLCISSNEDLKLSN